MRTLGAGGCLSQRAKEVRLVSLLRRPQQSPALVISLDNARPSLAHDESVKSRKQYLLIEVEGGDSCGIAKIEDPAGSVASEEAEIEPAESVRL